jgi:hypothetical protein
MLPHEAPSTMQEPSFVRDALSGLVLLQGGG